MGYESFIELDNRGSCGFVWEERYFLPLLKMAELLIL